MLSNRIFTKKRDLVKFQAIACFLLYCFTTSSALAEENKHAFNTWGIELDALPYITGGYYISGWAAFSNFRYRAVAANTNVPDFAIKDGFDDLEINAYALIVDYFQDQSLKGLWFGGGLEYWDSRITEEVSADSAQFNNTVATVGGGYVWYFAEQWYLNPWGALHIIIGGDKDVTVGNKTYQPPVVSGEISIKLGWKF